MARSHVGAAIGDLGSLTTVFRTWDPDECEFLSSAFRDLVRSGHAVHFVRRGATADPNLAALDAPKVGESAS